MAASDLLKPDPVESMTIEEDEDLESLRLAALNSMRPKKPAFTLRVHPQRSNLLAIVPVEETPSPQARGPPPKWVQQGDGLPPPPQPSKTAEEQTQRTTDKFSRFDRESESEESEYSEYSEYVSETDEDDAEEVGGEKKEIAVEADVGKAAEKPVEEADDVLNVDCTDEVDEFSSLLKEFEDELLPGTSKGDVEKLKKKRKQVRVMKKRLKKKAGAATTSLDTTHSSEMTTDSSVVEPRRTSPSPKHRGRTSFPSPHYRNRSPPPHRTPPPPPRFRDRSPIGRGYSSSHTRGRGGSPFSRQQEKSHSPFYQYRSPSPREYRKRSPRRSPKRVSPFPQRRSPYRRSPPNKKVDGSSASRSPHKGQVFNDAPGRGGSAPRYEEQKHSSREKDANRRYPIDDAKSRSLPPKHQGVAGPRGGDSQERNGRSSAKEKEFDERLRKLPTPEREKLLARKLKFSQQSVAVPKKVICLKAIHTEPSAESTTIGSKQGNRVKPLVSEDAVSLSGDVAIEKFEEEEEIPKRSTALDFKTKRGASGGAMFDLRVQLSKKRRQQELLEDDFDTAEGKDNEPEENDSLSGISASKRLPKVSESRSHRSLASTQKDSAISIRRTVEKIPKRRSVMDRLGEPVHNTITEELVLPKRRVLSPTLPSPAKMPKKEKKKDKKSKKKSKKKKKSKSRKHHEDESHSDESIDGDEEEENDGNSSGNIAPVFDKDEEELLAFFESPGKPISLAQNADDHSGTDDVMLRMKAKNDNRLKRLKEIEEDKRQHK